MDLKEGGREGGRKGGREGGGEEGEGEGEAKAKKVSDTQLVSRKGRVEEMERRGEERREGRRGAERGRKREGMDKRKVPQNSWVVLLLKHAGLPPDDHPVPVWLLLHVGGVAGPVEGEEEGTVGHVVGLQLEETVEGIDCGLDPWPPRGGGGGGGEGGREEREGGEKREREGEGGREKRRKSLTNSMIYITSLLPPSLLPSSLLPPYLQ